MPLSTGCSISISFGATFDLSGSGAFFVAEGLSLFVFILELALSVLTFAIAVVFSCVVGFVLSLPSSTT